jgi:hypothetical protein
LEEGKKSVNEHIIPDDDPDLGYLEHGFFSHSLLHVLAERKDLKCQE